MSDKEGLSSAVTAIKDAISLVKKENRREAFAICFAGIILYAMLFAWDDNWITSILKVVLCLPASLCVWLLISILALQKSDRQQEDSNAKRSREELRAREGYLRRLNDSEKKILAYFLVKNTLQGWFRASSPDIARLCEHNLLTPGMTFRPPRRLYTMDRQTHDYLSANVEMWFGKFPGDVVDGENL